MYGYAYELHFSESFDRSRMLYSEKKDIFYRFFFLILSDKKRESSDLVHIVEQLILYKTLYRVMLPNSNFPNFLLAQASQGMVFVI